MSSFSNGTAAHKRLYGDFYGKNTPKSRRFNVIQITNSGILIKGDLAHEKQPMTGVWEETPRGPGQTPGGGRGQSPLKLKGFASVYAQRLDEIGAIFVFYKRFNKQKSTFK